MPVLVDARREAFAWALAEGRPGVEAYRECGFKGKAANQARYARRMAARPSMVARVAEIHEEMAWSRNLKPARVLDSLAWLHRRACRLDSAAGIMAAKGILLEALRLKARLDEEGPAADEWPPLPPPMSRAEWKETYGSQRRQE